jgi:hypothetical protein
VAPVTAVWVTIAALCAGTATIKAAGPVALGGREPGERTLAVITLFAPALLAALVVYQSLSSKDGGIAVDERLLGVAAAGTALALRQSMWVVVVAAAATTALARALL